MIGNRRSAASARQILLLLLLLPIATASPVTAQSRFEAGVSATWTGGFDAGGGDALLTRNPSTGTSPLILFATSSRVQSAPGAVAHAAFYLTPRMAVEAVFDYSRPILHTDISNDFEGATGTSAETTVSSYVFGGSFLYYFGGGRLVPFVSAGAGRLRQLDEEDVTLVTGTELHAGGGVKYRLGRHASLRAEFEASSRDRSISFEDSRHTVPRLSAGFSYRF